jgi:hypothetical protein
VRAKRMRKMGANQAAMDNDGWMEVKGSKAAPRASQSQESRSVGRVKSGVDDIEAHPFLRIAQRGMTVVSVQSLCTRVSRCHESRATMGSGHCVPGSAGGLQSVDGVLEGDNENCRHIPLTFASILPDERRATSMRTNRPSGSCQLLHAGHTLLILIWFHSLTFSHVTSFARQRGLR